MRCYELFQYNKYNNEQSKENTYHGRFTSLAGYVAPSHLSVKWNKREQVSISTWQYILSTSCEHILYNNNQTH